MINTDPPEQFTSITNEKSDIADCMMMFHANAALK
jgi:hypothetical protein